MVVLFNTVGALPAWVPVCVLATVRALRRGCGVVGVALVLSAFMEVGVDVNKAISGSVGVSRYEIQRSEGALVSRCSGGEIARRLWLSI